MSQFSQRLYGFSTAGNYHCVIKYGGHSFQGRIDFDPVPVCAFNAPLDERQRNAAQPPGR
jgi:hypothetical protein